MYINRSQSEAVDKIKYKMQNVETLDKHIEFVTGFVDKGGPESHEYEVFSDWLIRQVNGKRQRFDFFNSHCL